MVTGLPVGPKLQNLPLREDISIDETFVSHKFLPDELVDCWVECTNKYAASKLPPQRRRPVTRACILHFIAIIYYMGLVKCPAREDYFRDSNEVWPLHPVCQGMGRDRFAYIWRYFHISFNKERDVIEEPVEFFEEDIEVDDDESVGSVLEGDADEEEDLMGRASREFTEEQMEEEEEEEQEEENGVGGEEEEVWFGRVSDFVDHVNKTSQFLFKPGTNISLDEMMRLFKGRSKQTYMMRQKPIKKGFKFWAVSDTVSGFCYFFKPSGRLVKEKVKDTVLECLGMLPDKETMQYICGMDNYFTVQGVPSGCHDMGIGMVGTAHARKGWPPKEFKEVNDNRFNTLYYLDGEDDKYRMFCWVDNNLVTMVSTVNDGSEEIEKNRKKPRENSTNE